MTVAIKRNNGDLFWFDTVLTFSSQRSGSVSKHPLEDGSIITDHTTLDNEIISIAGVLSDADFNLNRPLIDQTRADLFGVTAKEFVNNTPVTRAPTREGVGEEILYNNILITETSGLTRFLPESIGQFFGTGAPEVKLDERTPTKVMPALAVQQTLKVMFDNREDFSVLSFIDRQLEEAYDNCVMTSLSFAEDADSGDAVYPVITIERVRYAVSTSVRISAAVSSDIEQQATPEQNKGKQIAASGTSEDASLDPNQPQDNSDKTRISIINTPRGTR